MLWGEVPQQNYTHSDICPLVFLIRSSGTDRDRQQEWRYNQKRGEENGTKSNYAGNA